MIIKKVPMTASLAALLLLLLWDWIELGTAGGLGFIRNNIAWILITLAISLGIYTALTKREVKLPKASVVIIVGFFIAVLPFFLNINQYFSYGWLLPVGLSGCILFYLSLFQSTLLKQNHCKILWVLVFGCIFETFIGCWQLFHGLMMQVTSDVQSFEVVVVNGTFNQENVFASFISTGLLASYFLLVSQTSSKGNTHVKGLLLLKGFLFLGSFILLISSSKVGLISLVFGVAVLSLAHIDLKRKVFKLGALVLLGLVIAQVLTVTIYPKNVDQFSGTQSREVMYATAVDAIYKKPLIGHGLGSFERVNLETLIEKKDRGDFGTGQPARNANLSHPHNEILYWGIQGGVVSVLGLLVIVSGVLLSTWKAGFKVNLVYFTLLSPIVLHLMVELPFYISGVHLIVSLLLLYFIVQSIGRVETSSLLINRGASLTLKVITTITAVFVSSIMVINSYSLAQAVKYETSLNRTEKQLQKVIFTVGWTAAYESLLLKHRANIAARTGEQEPIKEFLSWLKTQNEISPRLQYYFNIYYSYKLLGATAEAKKAKDDIVRYYSGTKQADAWLELN